MFEHSSPQFRQSSLEKRLDKVLEEFSTYNNIYDQAMDSNHISLNHTVKLIESFLDSAEENSSPRHKWPNKLNRFPFSLFKWVQKPVFKVINVVTKKQRQINYDLSFACRELISLNLKTVERLQELESKILVYEDKYNVLQNQALDSKDQINLLKSNILLQNQSIQSLKEERDLLKIDILLQKNFISSLIAEVKQNESIQNRPDQDSASVKLVQDLINHELDTFYLSFENIFRGSKELITQRLEIYLPYIDQAVSNTSSRQFLDVGCGRGEWLELLKGHGVLGKGIDLNSAAISSCQARGLDVLEADVIQYMSQLEDQSLAGVTGFHIIEHLPFAILMKLYAEVLRILKPGGLVIFETPNPENILVGACRFYHDPTHRNPIPPPVTEFIMHFYGFRNVEILRLNPSIDTLIEGDSEIVSQFNHFFYGPMDYAVVGFKP